VIPKHGRRLGALELQEAANALLPQDREQSDRKNLTSLRLGGLV